MLLDSGLRGRGGGGFPTGLKWKLAKQNDADQKYVCCNADEGDPGAFMDRSVLEGDPHAVLEAMAIAGYAIGASQAIFTSALSIPSRVERLKIAIKQAATWNCWARTSSVPDLTLTSTCAWAPAPSYAARKPL